MAMQYTRSAGYGIRVPTDPSEPDVPEAMATTVSDVEEVLSRLDAGVLEAAYYKKDALTANSVLDTVGPGSFSATNGTTAEALALPDGWPGTLTSSPVGAQGGTQFFYSLKGRTFTRRRFRARWSEWMEVGRGHTRRELLRQSLLARKGQSIGTDGRGVVALRFDDDHQAFLDKVVPLLRERGLPFSFATPSVSKGGQAITQAVIAAVEDACLAHGGEVWHHSATHTNVDFMGDVHREIASSREVLAAKMPRVPVDCFAPPRTGISYGGYMPSYTVDNYSTYAGQQAVESHALVSGYIQETYWWQLDGQARDGAMQYDFDKYTLTRARDRMNLARDNGVGMVFSWHPDVLGTEGYMTLADFTDFLDYLAAQRAVGAIEVLTVSGMAVADKASAVRHDLLGATRSAWGSTSYEYTITDPQFRSGVPGSTRVLQALVKATPGSTVTTTVGTSTKTHAIPPGGYLRVYHPVTIPLNVNGGLVVKINAHASEVHLYAV